MVYKIEKNVAIPRTNFTTNIKYEEMINTVDVMAVGDSILLSCNKERQAFLMYGNKRGNFSPERRYVTRREGEGYRGFRVQ